MNLKPFGIKAYTFIMTPPGRDARFNILEGSIRASKTWAMMVKLLALSRYEVDGEPIAGFKVITGVSKNAIYQNVLKDLFDLVGKTNYNYNRQTGLLQIFDAEWLVIGAKDEGSVKLIQGMTIGVVYCDELTNMPESFYLMLTSRMSPKGARLYATCNPADPYHYVKRTIIDNPDLKKAGDVKVLHFTLDDNPNLSKETRAGYERQYKGMFYLRFIKGLWVIAEGAIYRDVWDEGNWATWKPESGMPLDQGVYYDDNTRPLGLFHRGGHLRRMLWVDHGTHNPCVFLDVYDDGTTLWVEKEYYWDSVEERRQKTNAEYAADLEEFVGADTAAVEIIVDPAAAGFKIELTSRGYWVTNADNEVVDGIQRVTALLGSRRLRFHRHNTPKTQVEMQTYAWDPKAPKGEERPIKKNDHGPDAVRYGVETKVPDWRIAA
jgi:hypothetical protein